MSLERRFHLLIGLVFGMGFAVFVTLDYIKHKSEAEENLQASAEHVHNVLLATRKVYQHQFVDSGLPLNEKTLGFLPAHAFSRISKELANWDKTGFSFDNVSDQPRNPAHRADALEMEAIEHFRRNPGDEVRFVPYTAPDGEPYYHYAHALRIEDYCLKCHGERAKAPETIRQLYDTAYDYRVGDVRGILSIRIPARGMLAQMRQGLMMNLAWAGGTFVLSWLAIMWLVRRDIARPLDLLKAGIARLADGTGPGRVGALPSEFGAIGHAFDAMADKLEAERGRLAESEAHLREMTATMSEGLYVLDEAGQIVFANPEAHRLLGRTDGELVGMMGYLLCVTIDGKSCSSASCKIASMPEAGEFYRSEEVIFRRRDGSLLPVELSSAPIRRDGRIAGKVVTFGDISGRKR